MALRLLTFFQKAILFCCEMIKNRDSKAMAFSVEQTFQFLKSAYENERLAHALLIVDEAQKGAEELVVRLVNLLNGTEATQWQNLENEYCLLVRPRSKTRKILIEDVREAEPFFQKKALPGKWKVGVFLEAEGFNENAENAFLKTLEEPPPHSLILLVVSNPERLMSTIRSRCVRVDLHHSFSGFPLSDLHRQLMPSWRLLLDHLGEEKKVILFRMELSARLSALRQEIKESVEKEAKQMAKKVSQSSGVTDWENQMESQMVAQIEALYLTERESVFDFMMAWLGDILKCKVGGEGLFFEEDRADIEKWAQRESVPRLLARIESLEALQSDLRTNVHEELAFDVRFLEAFSG